MKNVLVGLRIQEIEKTKNVICDNIKVIEINKITICLIRLYD